jgi:hypothetical protein
MTMTPNSPQELMDLQGTSELDNLCDHLFNDLSPSDGLVVCKRVLNGLLKLHKDVLKDKVQQGDPEQVVLWTNDTTKLMMVLDILKDLDL